MGLHVVLYQPEIPANTGNIARTCAATNTVLHLIRPLGFSTDDKMLKRAGLDYWKYVDVRYYDSLDIFLASYPEEDFYFITKFGEHYYHEFDFSDSEKDYFFIFGRETNGLPEMVHKRFKNRCLRIP
ncbi:MAG TPA: tRNA (cytidine(34)-2'-O)-methyltransferase, partial [Massilibacterium sp.]|nr:tRNA (cytidine(34)-2'-O)-methyltransferase [Massilibacterium sp.]